MPSRKGPSRVVCINTAAPAGDPQDLPPQPAPAKRKFSGNRFTRRSVIAMHSLWVHKVARFYRIPPEIVEEQVREAMEERRAA